jgi:hypothetical protein
MHVADAAEDQATRKTRADARFSAGRTRELPELGPARRGKAIGAAREQRDEHADSAVDDRCGHGFLTEGVNGFFDAIRTRQLSGEGSGCHLPVSWLPVQ